MKLGTHWKIVSRPFVSILSILAEGFGIPGESGLVRVEGFRVKGGLVHCIGANAKSVVEDAIFLLPLEVRGGDGRPWRFRTPIHPISKSKRLRETWGKAPPGALETCDAGGILRSELADPLLLRAVVRAPAGSTLQGFSEKADSGRAQAVGKSQHVSAEVELNVRGLSEDKVAIPFGWLRGLGIGVCILDGNAPKLMQTTSFESS